MTNPIQASDALDLVGKKSRLVREADKLRPRLKWLEEEIARVDVALGKAAATLRAEKDSGR